MLVRGDLESWERQLQRERREQTETACNSRVCLRRVHLSQTWTGVQTVHCWCGLLTRFCPDTIFHATQRRSLQLQRSTQRRHPACAGGCSLTSHLLLQIARREMSFQDEAIAEFVSLTGTDEAFAKSFLENHSWDLQLATHTYLESAGSQENAPAVFQPQFRYVIKLFAARLVQRNA